MKSAVGFALVLGINAVAAQSPPPQPSFVFEPIEGTKTVAEVLADKKGPCTIVMTPKGPFKACPNRIPAEIQSGIDRALQQ